MSLSDLENIEGNIDIFISESDHKVIESNKDIKKEISGLRLYPNKDLKHTKKKQHGNNLFLP